MSIEQLLRERREAIQLIAEKHGARNIRVFGSVARGEARSDSDVDFLVETGSETSSWFPAGLVLDLEELLGNKVEVVTERASIHLSKIKSFARPGRCEGRPRLPPTHPGVHSTH
ncbi:MAG: DNA polymerase subunit beta [Acidobacteria bacterium]|nr:MAG: DNA polymerase subunit beta [Acidobacteriota bacterium]